MIAATLGTVAAAGALWFGVPQLAKGIAIGRLRERCRRTRSLVLTYDDGPGDRITPRLLELLAERGARATFFVTARGAGRRTALTDAVRAAGHELGCHSALHRHAWKSLPWTATADLHAGFRQTARWVARDGLYRPPYGKLNLASWMAASARGARLAWWTVDSGDTWPALPDEDAIVEQVRAAGGAVVLMHDFDRSGPDAVRREEYVIALTTRLLDLAARESLVVHTYGSLTCLD